ncbi:MAG: hypothetical protein ABSE49_14705 [Polyangiaceae bacterium]|jgi:hypothetical protein
MRIAVVLVVAVAVAVACHRPRGTAAMTCDAAAACPADAYCAYTPRLCGKGKKPGVCTPRPPGCDGATDPVCGCDGQVYEGACAAHAAGVDLAVNGGCSRRVPDWIPCGAAYCDARRSYCEIVLSDVAELPTDYTCKPLPAACRDDGGATPSCDCFPAGTRCLSFCGHVETGGVTGFHLTCRL